MTRKATMTALAAAAGPSVRVASLDVAWPADVEVAISDGRHVDVAVHVSSVLGLSVGAGMARGNVGELRFQNPGQGRPVVASPGQIPLLLGWEQGPPPVIVFADATRRIGSGTRFSVRFPESLVKEAQALGAAEYVSTSGERLLAVTPALFSTVVEGAAEKLHLDVLALQQIAAGAGLLVSPADEKAATRARKAAERLVRDARFRKDVLAAYSDRCALCGLGLGTVVGAHVYPAAAPASTDAVTNGIALCANHHIIYDKHMLAFERQGDELLLRINPALASNLDPRDRVLIEALPREVRQPAKISKRITDQNLEARRAYFDPAYDWV